MLAVGTWKSFCTRMKTKTATRFDETREKIYLYMGCLIF